MRLGSRTRISASGRVDPSGVDHAKTTRSSGCEFEITDVDRLSCQPRTSRLKAWGPWAVRVIHAPARGTLIRIVLEDRPFRGPAAATSRYRALVDPFPSIRPNKDGGLILGPVLEVKSTNCLRHRLPGLPVDHSSGDDQSRRQARSCSISVGSRYLDLGATRGVRFELN